jgi:hypothetical protein
MSWIKANYSDLINLSEAMYNAPSNSVTRYLFTVYEIDGNGYCEHSEAIESEIDFAYEIQEEDPRPSE